ncbi:MAG: hypothetical protein HY367_00840 [Candidatus Aenigmarchaeota archaeon]|nr:hypothetical protein [Candidatus Aenigmarchaeota archaeon]
MQAAHDTDVVITPEVANCGQINQTFTLKITNIGGPDSIREVRIYQDADLNGQKDPGIVEFKCGDPPEGWTLTDRLSLFNYCQYEAPFTSAFMIDPGEMLEFMFMATLDDTNLQCGNEFRVATIDDASPVGQVVFKFPQIKVDCSPPDIDKRVGDPKIACDPETESCDYWLTQDTQIDFSASDNQDECDLGLDYCQWRTTLDNEEPGDWQVEENGGVVNWGLSFSEDSNHLIEVECFDVAGNNATLEELDKVDSTPPETTKQFNGPQHTNEDGVEWIDGVTTVTLNPSDPDPSGFSCNIGVDKTWYLNVLAEENTPCESPQEACRPVFASPYEQSGACIEEAQGICLEAGEQGSPEWIRCVESFAHEECGVDGRWHLYDGNPIPKDEESCHILQYFSVDELGNVEDMNANCFFVDKTPPEISKDVDGPQAGNCPPGEEDKCFITSDTNVILSCQDQQPHPSGGEMIFSRYRFTEDGQVWSDWLPTADCPGQVVEGWCKVNSQETSVSFPESSQHELQFYCKDAVEKTSEIDTESFGVDNDPPVITKEMFGSWLGDCPPGEGDVCYVADNGQSGVSVWVADQESIHASDDVSCVYEIIWHSPQGEVQVGEGSFSDHADIIFQEDSTHDLIVTCRDAVGNTVRDVETFLVDSTPPETTKMYGEPFFENEICEGDGQQYEECMTQEFINSSTPISLWAEDEKVGVDSVSYRVTLVPDSYCQNQEYNCVPCEETSDECTDFTEVAGEHANFTIPDESCHLIEFFSTDLLGNTERRKWQCAFVDNTPPQTDKEIGEPKVVKVTKEVCEEQPEGGNGISLDGFDVGDVVHQLNASEFTFPGYTEFCSVGLAFDGASLYYNRCGDVNIYKIDPVTGALEDTFDTEVALNPNAMAFDKKRNGIWFGTQACTGSPRTMPIYFWDFDDDSVSLEFSVPETLVNPGTGQDFLNVCFLDGLAYNENDPDTDADDELWFSDDVNKNLGLFRPDGSLVDGFDATDAHASLSTLSGLAIGGPNLYMANNGGGDVFRADKDTLALVDQFASEDERLEDMECDPVTFAPTEVMWVRHTPQGNADDDLITAFAIEPGTCGLGGQPVCQNVTTEVFITQDTPITLSCEDQEPHPSDHVSMHWRFRINGGEWSEWQWNDGSVTEISFDEDSRHELEFFCTDVLGNEEEHQTEVDIVDSQPPVIEKTIVGPSFGECPPDPESEESCIIDGVTTIHVEAADPEPHPVGGVTCDWSYVVLETQASGGEEGVEPPFDISFPEESTHVLSIACRDELGNTAADREVFVVDKTPPVTRKRFEGPQFPLDNDGESTSHWISSQTDVILDAYDPEPHPSGVAATYWRNTIVDNENCQSVEICQQAEGEGEFQLYTGPFRKNEESCHLIEYYSVDNVNKTERVNKQCVFVDNTPPEPDKTVGEPSDIWTPGENGDPASIYYPNETANCWTNLDGSIECWEVTTLTPITLDCSDPEPHPVDNENVCFKVDFDGKDKTEDYCNRDGINGEIAEDGSCCVLGERAPIELFFGEESEHNLQFYCVDALGNQGPVDEEKFKVEGTAFRIWLNKKWNLISVPFVLQDDSPEKVFEDVMDDVVAIWTYDAVVGQWYVFTPDGVDNDDLGSIVPGMGYWVLAKDDAELVLGGSLFSPAVTPPSKEIAPGWNLIGYYGNEGEEGPLLVYHGPDGNGKQARCALGSLVDTTLGKEKWSALVTYWEPFNTDGNPETSVWKGFGTRDNMDPGAGYWLEIAGPELYTFSTTCGL